jgi:hypothetical protein
MARSRLVVCGVLASLLYVGTDILAAIGYATVGPERAKPYEGHFTHHSER